MKMVLWKGWNKCFNPQKPSSSSDIYKKEEFEEDENEEEDNEKLDQDDEGDEQTIQKESTASTMYDYGYIEFCYEVIF